MSRIVVGIDLGTTNSSVACVQAGRPTLIEVDGSPLMPSVVGLGPGGELLVGAAARNQRHVFPERTIASIKRRMGEDVRLSLGESEHTPVEISAMILRRLKLAAEAHLGQPVERAVITVPAYFSDAQRTATREAGEIAGFRVERILNEPTAAALGYVTGDEDRERTLLIYDLGGGTFDVSIVRARGEVTEVLASHGDTALGGDDFDELLALALRGRFLRRHDQPLEGDLRVAVRLARAAEEAKIRLSDHTHARVMEEHIVEAGGVPRHLDEEIDRPTYEELIEPLLERTRDSVHIALREAGLLARDLDDVVLVGGSTRTPRVADMLRELLGQFPRRDIDPEKAVAIGAALLASRIAGDTSGRILVDVTPFSFGISYLGELNGTVSNHCYRPIIRRNTPLPTRQSEIFYTIHEGQERVETEVYQGENDDARENIPLGHFVVDGLDPLAPETSPIVYDLALDLDGILHVEATERHTGLKRAVTIEDAFRTLTPQEIADAREKVRAAFGPEIPRVPGGADGALEPGAGPAIPAPPAEMDADSAAAWTIATSLLEKAAQLRPELESVDAEEVDELTTQLRGALQDVDAARMRAVSEELADVLFYLE